MKTILFAAALALAPAVAAPAFAANNVPAAPATAAAPAPAPATPASPRASMMFWFLDRNGDGVIDAAEITAYRTARFQSLDTNGDGVLTKEEALAGMHSGRGPGHHRPGKNHGPNAGPDGDQAAKADDQDARKAKFAERRQKRDDKALERMGFTGDVTEVTLAVFLQQPTPMLARLDVDKDGRITKAEFLSHPGRGGAPIPN